MKKIFAFLFALLTPFILIKAQAISFLSPVNYTVGDSTTAIVSADFNGDSKLDIAVLEYGEKTIGIIFNNGDGTFSSSINFIDLNVNRNISPSSLGTLTANDFNADGHTDLAVIFKDIDSVGILINNGDGTFASRVAYQTGDGPISVSNADLNGDRKTDLVTVNNLGNNISVLLNNGDGTFANKVDYSGSFFSPHNLVLSDFNSDGNIDIINEGNSSPEGHDIFLNNGDGTFGTPILWGSGNSITDIKTSDFNNDGVSDVVFVSRTSPNVKVQFGRGDGRFNTTTFYNTGSPFVNTSRFVGVGDFNNDGNSEFVVLNTDSVNVFTNRGDGTFITPINFPKMNTSVGITVGDFNSDGKLDFIGASYSGKIEVYLNGTIGPDFGSFSAKMDFATASGPFGLASADFNKDGKLDLVTSNFSSTVSILLGNGDGTLQTKSDITFTSNKPVNSVVTGDFNGDSNPDIAVTNGNNHDFVSVILGNGNGTFSAKTEFATANQPSGMGKGDFNSDGKIDLVVANSGANIFSLLLGNGDGTFTVSAFGTGHPSGYTPSYTNVNDFNNDGKLDIAIVYEINKIVSIYLGDGMGSFSANTDYSIGNNPIMIVSGKFNNDHNVDLAIVNGSFLSVFMGNGDGTFLSKVDYQINYSFTTAFYADTADFNKDGFTDLIASSADSVSVFINKGDGTFNPKVDYSSGRSAFQVISADMNNDGALDIAVNNNLDNTISILLNQNNTALNFINPPTVLSTSATSINNVNLSWFDNSSNETGYTIERTAAEGSIFSLLINLSANVTTYTDATVTEGKHYKYRVKAVNATASSSYSNESLILTPISSLLPPSAVTIVPDTAGHVSISWQDNSSDELGFIILRGVVGSSVYSSREFLNLFNENAITDQSAVLIPIDTVNANITNYIDLNTQEGQPYKYEVKAYNNSGVSTGQTDSSKSVVIVLVSPSNLSTFLTGTTTVKINLVWKNNSQIAFGEIIERSTNNLLNFVVIDTVGVGDSTYIDSLVTIGNMYFYRIKSFMGDNYSAYESTLTGVIVTDVEKIDNDIPKSYFLSQNYPNPFNPSTIIRYQLPVKSKVSLKVYDILGKEVASLVNEEQSAGNYKINFSFSNLASGIYFYRIQAGKFTQSKKMILLK